jgi:outer membrane protein assembly factor BamD (BamD/ComL family)
MKSAVIVLALSMMLFAGCSKKSAPELMQLAQETHQRAQFTADSLGMKANVQELFGPVIQKYEEVVKEHPTTPEAEQSLFKIAELHAGVLKDPVKAVDDFRRYATSFPSGVKTQTAMFMIGYIYNNELNMIDSAGVAYRRFLERFPESELATSAQYELNTLGKRPEEMLPPEEPPSSPPAAKKSAGKNS